MIKKFEAKYGVSMYKGILVIWDEDKDERVLQVIDQLKTDNLIAINEHEASIKLWWNKEPRYKIGTELEVDAGNDIFEITENIVVQNNTVDIIF